MKRTCKQCSQLILRYVDEVNELDRELALIANLCMAASDPELADAQDG